MKRVVVFGLGGIGGYIAAKLGATSAFGTELIFIARGAHLKAIRDKGLRYRNPNGQDIIVRPFLATDNPAEAGNADMIFFCVKGYDLKSACEAASPMVGHETVILPLLNGADIYERVRSVISGCIVLPGCIYISSSIAEPGVVFHLGGKGNIFLGGEPGRDDFDPAPLLDLLEKGGIPHEWLEDPLPAIWTKYIFIAPYGLVTGMSAKTIGEVIADQHLASLVQGIQKEIAAIAGAKGIHLPDDAAQKAFESGKAFPFDTKTSFQRDLEVLGNPHEGDIFGGTILRLGRETGVPTPVTAGVYQRIPVSGSDRKNN
jgi:2-dehydropantoate 2-reductase